MKRIQKFCREVPGLEQIADRASALEQLTRVTRSAVPEAMRSHVLTCVVREQTLVIFTDTAAWGSQLRFLQPAILDALERETGRRLASVRFKVHLANEPSREKSSQTVRRQVRSIISSRSRDVIRSAADGIDDPGLSAALRRLARKDDQDA